MKSPIFVAFPGSPWRSGLLATWRYLRNNYEITGNEHCGTHVHISVEGGYGFEEIKRIAKSALYFKPAFEALVPLHRTGGKCEYAKNLWPDGNDLANDNTSRLECCKLIDTVRGFISREKIINPDRKGLNWNFRCIWKFYAIKFRKPPACTTADEVLAWAEIAMAFTHSSIRNGILDLLQTIPSTVGGLCSFLERSHINGWSQHSRFETVFGGKDPNSFFESTPWGRQWSSGPMWEKFERKKNADRKRIQRLDFIRTAKEPYMCL